MKKIVSKNLYKLVFISLLIITTTLILFAYPTGYTGATKKTSTTGCYCHTQNTAITGSITGPDTVNVGTTTQYTITINRSGYSGDHGGIDVAVRLGTLSPNPSSSILKLQSGELTHQSPMTFTSGTASAIFSYIAPSSPGIDTIWSTVAGGYSNGWNFSPEKRVMVINPNGVQKNQSESNFKLNQNYPNPFNPKTIISFSIPKETNVSLDIYDILGNKIDNIYNGKLNAGNHEIDWNAQNFSSGIYFYTLKTDAITFTKKMILSK